MTNKKFDQYLEKAERILSEKLTQFHMDIATSIQSNGRYTD